MKKTSRLNAPHEQRRQKKLQRRKIKAQEKLKARRRAAATRSKADRDHVVHLIYQTILHHFPNLFQWFAEVDDPRARCKYGIAEILVACLAMYLFKFDSRNAMNNAVNDCAPHRRFKKNLEKLLHIKMPHMDTVHDVMAKLEPQHLECIKVKMIQGLLARKVLHKYRMQGQYFVIAVDATGVTSYDHLHCDQCLHRTSKNGHTTHFHNVLEAKLVFNNGLVISIATEWIENPPDGYEIQDAELKAFQRLVVKLKSYFPRLPVCIATDSLYPNEGFFEACQKCNWRFVTCFKKGCIDSVWQQAEQAKVDHPENTLQVTDQHDQNKCFSLNYFWVLNLNYRGHCLHQIECEETVINHAEPDAENKTKRFVYLTDIPVDKHNIEELINAGRLRWKIENEGYNTQKNFYHMGNQYARKSLQAMKNYYQMLQIAHLINALTELSQSFERLRQKRGSKITIKHLWNDAISFLSCVELDEAVLESIRKERIQIRFIS